MNKRKTDSAPSLKTLILKRTNQKKFFGKVWIPQDFLDLGQRDAVDKILQRMVKSRDLRRVARGLYDKPRLNKFTQKLMSEDYRSVIEAVSRREHIRILIDGITAANDLGLTNAVPGKVTVRTEGRVRPIKLHNLTIEFKRTTPSKLYWAGRPSMRIVQALYWLQDSIKKDKQTNKEIKTKIKLWLRNSNHKFLICKDLQSGLSTLPQWMRTWIQELLDLIKKEEK